MILVPVTGVVSWLAGSKMRRNDMLQKQQDSIDLLSTRNKELLEEVVGLRSEVAKLKTENSALRSEVEEVNHKLEHVKTITRYAK